MESPTTALAALHAALQAPPFQSNPASQTDQDANHRLASSVKALEQWALSHNWTPAPADLSRAIDKAQLESLDSLVAVANSLVKGADAVHSDIATIRTAIDSISSDFDRTRELTSQFVRAASEQQVVIDSIVQQQTSTSDLIAQYTLSPLEIAQLSAHSSDLTDEFFSAFDRAVAINTNARANLDYPNTPLSQDIVSVVEDLLQTSHDRLYSWTQARLPTFAVVSPEIPTLLPKAIARLVQGRPVLANALFDEAISYRKTAVSRWFSDLVVARDNAPLPSNTSSMMANSVSSTGGLRESMMSGTTQADTERRSGDVFAWIHQALSAELILWTVEVGPDGIIPRNKAVHFADVTLGAVTRPIVSIIENIVSRASLPVAAAGALVSAVDTVAAYRVYHVLGMNRDVLLKSLPSSAALVQITYELQHFCLRQFKDALDMQAQVLKSSHDPIDFDSLCPPPIVLRTVQSLNAISSTRDRYINQAQHQLVDAEPVSGSFKSEKVDHEKTHADENKLGDLERSQLRSLLDTLIDPCIQSCVVAASSNRTLSRTSGAVFIINCLGALYDAVKALSDDKALALEKQIEIYMDTLVNEQYDTLVRQSGMRDIFDKFQHQLAGSYTLSNLQLDPGHLKSALDKLDQMLMTSLHRDLQHIDFSKLSNPELVADIATQGNAAFLKAYTKLYECLASEQFTGIALRSIQEVESLFRV